MDAKILKTFWRDPDFEEEPPEVKLAALWAISNADVDVCGIFRYSPRSFKFDTNADPKVFERLLEVSSSFTRFENGMVWCRNWIRYQVGDGESLSRNNMSRSINAQLDKLPDDIRNAVLERYPTLRAKRKQIKKESAPIKDDKRKDAETVLNKLNAIAKTEFMPVDANLKIISARLSECKNDIDGVFVMLHRQWESWRDTEHQQYYRPKTLFAVNNFPNYYGARNQPVKKSNDNLKVLLDETEGRIVMHPANRKSAAYNPHCTEAQKREFDGLVQKRDAIKRQMS
jgi:uncharacterized phage protein (TIGR02220 family)